MRAEPGELASRPFDPLGFLRVQIAALSPGSFALVMATGIVSNAYFFDGPRAVSDALGVQLLYTTGLFDTTALAEFPLVIRLRNDADLRAGLKYISVEEHLRPGLPQQDPDGETDDGVLLPDGTCAGGDETCVGAGEGWLTELSNSELKNLFALRQEAIGE